MSFNKILPYKNDSDKAIKLVKEVFLPLGFKILNKTDDFIEFGAEGNLSSKSCWWKQDKESLSCITKISFNFAKRKLSVQADFIKIDKSISYKPVFAAIIIIALLVAIDIKFYLHGKAFPLIFFLPIIALTACVSGVLAILPGFYLKRNATAMIENLINQIETLE